ncbi:hypothetical protein A4A49_01747 [Nicotiana attenuata]|uniref:DUF4283 domain-containing protein n=1 Tax=Nicotiana attenuata TaxID=49451 RepID=A0A1J6I452_NICAT|nr:hypothetical protein A4A49_01747 [Nicotiana attenuata]
MGRGRGRGRLRPKKAQKTPITMSGSSTNNNANAGKVIQVQTQELKTPEQQGIVMAGIDEATSSISSEVSRKLSLSAPIPTEQIGTSTNRRVEEKFNGIVDAPNPKDMQKAGVLSKEHATNQTETSIGPNENEIVNKNPKETNHAEGRAELRAWAKLFQQNRVATHGMPLRCVPPQIVDGQTVVKLDLQDVKVAEEKWNAALIAYIIGDNPGYNAMRRYIAQHWLDVAEADLFLHDDGYYVIKFQTLIDMYQVFYSGPHIIRNRPIILKPYTLEFDLSKEVLTDIPSKHESPMQGC